MIDIHSHILPGVDDGARTLTDSMDIIRELAGSGVTDVVMTPHYVSDTKYVSSRRDNLRLISDLKAALSDEGLNINVYLGNEIYINTEIITLIKKGVISPMANSEFLLVELPLNGEFPNYEDYLDDLIRFGYKVILAHPERYEIVQEDYDIINRLNGQGVLFQCNLGSILGQYGRAAKRVIKKLAKDNFVFALGSDIHHCHGAEYWRKAQQKLAKYYSKSEFEKVMITNPRQMLFS